MMDNRTMQRALAAAGFYNASIDGFWGLGSKAGAKAFLTGTGTSVAGWPHDRVKIGLEQQIMAEAGINPGLVDGLAGPDTKYARELWQNRLRDIDPDPTEVSHQPRIFPRQRTAEFDAFWGDPGANQVMLETAYPMRLAWKLETTVSRFSIHAKAVDSAERAFKLILEQYGLAEIKRLGLDLFGGCLNVRKMRGGSSMSMHSWGIAIDFDPTHNGFRWGADRARMDGPEYAKFLDIWESLGWISLGRERNFDWMHVQAARL